MKNIFKILIFMVLLNFASCTQDNIGPADISLKGEKIPSTTTIQYLEEQYMVTDRTVPGYYTADYIPAGDSCLIFNGIVTSFDLAGNLYKYITVQEDSALTQTPRAIRISIDANNISNILPIGQRISFTANNWYIGKYGNSPQMGSYFPRPQDGRLSPGAMPMAIVKKSLVAYGKPDVKAVLADTMTIAQILTYKTHHLDIDWKLIAIKNAYFTQLGGAVTDPDRPADRIIFAPSTNGANYPQAIEITDGTATINICTSEYAKFADTTIPSASYKGVITCIVSWYESTPNNANAAFQLTLRSLNDLGAGFEGYLQSVNN
jgi:hypothetical protein